MTAAGGPNAPIFKRDSGADLWIWVGLFAFGLRFPKDLGSLLGPLPPQHPRQTFLRYGAEMRVLEHDRTECLNEFVESCSVRYASAETINLQMFSAVYHVDNFNIRIHKLLDNTYLLLALAAGAVQVDDLDPRDHLPKHKEIRAALEKRRLGQLAMSVRTFTREALVDAALKDRHRFVHRYRDEPHWPMLEAAERCDDDVDPLADAVRVLRSSNLPRYVKRKARDLDHIMGAVRKLRSDLFGAAGDAVLSIYQTPHRRRPPASRNREREPHHVLQRAGHSPRSARQSCR